MQTRDRRVFVMAGGYGVQIEETVQVQLNTYRIAVEYWERLNSANFEHKIGL